MLRLCFGSWVSASMHVCRCQSAVSSCYVGRPDLWITLISIVPKLYLCHCDKVTKALTEVN